MATALTAMSFSGGKVLAKADSSKAPTLKFSCLNQPWRSDPSTGGRLCFQTVAAVPDKIYEKVAESIKQAEEACAEDAVSGECAAAWDEVEELSAAASHARARKKELDPLETYCEDNPETDECRTYDN